MSRKMVPHDGNSATAHVAHAVNEVIAIYPITPSSGMGEISDEKSAAGEKNIWGTVPTVSELQSEGGAAGAVHGALCAGALTTTFTASQGLLLMIPNMYKIAGELTPTVFHVSARSLACQGLSIFGDHSDVMSVRQTGFALLSSTTVQEAMDFSLIAHAATLEARVPFLHFFDGFRTSHEMQKIDELSFDDMRAMIDSEMVRAHRNRSMSPDHPTIKGTAQNPDVYFQGRETVNPYYDKCAQIVQKYMDKFAELTGRQYHLFDYEGAPDAEKVIVIMGSGADTVHETVDYLNSKGEKTGVLKVRLYRPFDANALLAALPSTVKKIAVLDRTKEPGSLGEPLYEDIRTAIGESMQESDSKFTAWPTVIGGRYGLGSAEFTPAMIKATFDELDKSKPKNHFVIGINDNVAGSSLEFDKSFSVETDDVYRALFYGLGSDGTVSANKNSIKIITDKTDNNTQGYFVYDSKKAGTVTVSHLRFGKNDIRRPYLISTANFLACHNFSFIEKYDMLKNLVEGGTFLLTSQYDKDTVWENIPGKIQKQIIDKKLDFYVIDAVGIAQDIGLGPRINTIMQTAFFKISKVIDEKVAIDAIKDAIKKTYGSKGEAIVNMNIESIDKALGGVQKVEYPDKVTNAIEERAAVADNAPDFVKTVTAKIMKQEGDQIPVSDMPADGVWPVGTTKFEKRNIAVEIPVWNPETCIQCNRCSLVCPHAVIRPKVYDANHLDNAPETFKSTDAKGKEFAGMKYTLQVAPEDCTGCGICVQNCPAKAKEAITMQPQSPLREQEAKNWDFFLSIPDTDPSKINSNTVKGSQLIRPLFEFSGACAGCGETAYIKLVSQLVGDRAYIGNATGCSSIYGGNLPTTPYTTRDDGRGPTWNNSLFEDNAELAFGMRLTVDKFEEYARELCERVMAEDCCSAEVKNLIGEIVSAEQKTQNQIEEQRGRVEKVKSEISGCSSELCKELTTVIDYLVKKSVWAVGGDGWAYDIGYGGLDHVLATGKNVNILVLDTEVYSNTGGQSSKSTPMGAVAKFAASGKPTIKKDLSMIAMSYGYIYVARIALGANQNQAIKAIAEAEAYDGPSLILAYSHCIAHGINMVNGYEAQKLAVESGHWPLYRYNPDLSLEGKNPFILDSKDPSISLADYVYSENRYKILQRSNPEISKNLIDNAQKSVVAKFKMLKQLAAKED
ncbi:pyruvate:ferredoxin (flavodoxin) oxidoreductase [Chitinispirillales bacterium ANBcel5]|uniref:pyruvate:ferredoxin (flavodoxin) oxidoreductase n=1 Tax=Cellulosispirillum alkaliphilum TaxID=3039283 RepID=UPI002A57842C|nr:pyruvate:ferredoxin (flavodoxin) oxidoreductase [Chitinispirillales bacterium ANBcel5]